MAEEGDPALLFGSEAEKKIVSREITEAEKKTMDDDELRNTFKLFDQDNSGSINVDELRDAMTMLGVKTSRSAAQKALDLIDKDKSGVVEWEEFYEFFGKVRNPDEIKGLLSEVNHRFLDYKAEVEGDPKFASRYGMPPSVDAKKKFDGHGESVEGIAWLPDGRFASCTIDGELFLWNSADAARRPAPVARFSAPAEEGRYGIYTIFAGADGQHLLTSVTVKDDSLWLWNVETQSLEQKFKGHTNQVFGATLSPSCRFALSGGKAGLLCLHDLTRAEPVSSWQAHEGVVYSCVFDQEGDRVLSASSDGSVMIYDIKAVRAPKAMAKIEDAATGETVCKALWRGDFEVLSCGNDYCAKRWDVRKLGSGPITSYFGHTAAVKTLTLSSCGNFMLTTTDDGSIRVWFVDELGAAIGKRDALAADIQDKEAAKAALLLKVEAGDAGISEVNDLKDEIDRFEEDQDYLNRVIRERQHMACVQASVSLHGSSHPCTGTAWRDVDESTAQVVTSSKDQTCRLYNLDKVALAKLELWSEEAASAPTSPKSR